MTWPAGSHAYVIYRLYAEMITDRALKDYEEQRILTEIDVALRDRDRAAFVRLAEELRELRGE